MKKWLVRLDLDDASTGQPKYERLKEILVSEMVAGRLKPGHALPSEHHLVRTLGVARGTIRQAMVSLESDGLIRRVQGKGNFVEADAQRKLKRGLDIFALVVPETHGGLYPALLRGFEEAAGDIRHQTIICKTDNDLARQGDVILQLLDQGVGGVALVPTTLPLTPAYQIRQLQDRGVPVVFCHRRVEEIKAPLLAIPFLEVGRMAGRVLAEHGHRHVAFITTHWSPSTHTYEQGLQQSLRASGVDVPLESVCLGNTIFFEEKTVQATLQQVFARPNPPTAIFANSDSVVEMIYLVLPRLGLRVPEDVSLLGIGGAWREGALTRRLTSIAVDEIATGRHAVALLHEMRLGNRPIDDNEETVMELCLSDGETLAAPAQERARIA